MTPSAKLGTRLAAAAIIVAASTLATASVASNASGAARVTTVSGTGQPTLAGDSGPATMATLASPAGVAADASGIAIADTDNCRVRFVPNVDAKLFGITMHRVDIYTIAGSTCGSSGDDGPASQGAALVPGRRRLRPRRQRVRRRHGQQSHRHGFRQDGHDLLRRGGRPQRSVRYRSRRTRQSVHCRHERLSHPRTTRRPVPSALSPAAEPVATRATTARLPGAELLTPADVAVDAHGNLIIADTGNRRVREVAAHGRERTSASR